MKKLAAGFLLGVIVMASTFVFAETIETIEIIFGRIKLVVDGKAIEQDTILYEGTTYVPLRVVADALGKEVNYDAETMTAYVGRREAPDQEPGWSEKVEFDDLIISLGEDIEFMIFSKQYSEKDGAVVIRIPIKVRNLRNESHGISMFYYNFYNQMGTKADSFDMYYDDSVFSAGKMRAGAELMSNVYVEYSGDGYYFMELSDFYNKKEIRFLVTEPQE